MIFLNVSNACVCIHDVINMCTVICVYWINTSSRFYINKFCSICFNGDRTDFAVQEETGLKVPRQEQAVSSISNLVP